MSKVATDDQPTSAQLEAIEKETRQFTCPSCGECWQFRLSVSVKGVQRPPTPEESAARDGRQYIPPKKAKSDAIVYEDPSPPMGNNRPALIRLVQYYRDIGVLAAFEQVVTDLKAHQLPRDIGGHFLNWLKKCVRANQIPKLALRKLINEFDDGVIEVWHSDQVAAIVSNGQLRAFVPVHLLRGELVRLGTMSSTRLRTRATDEQLDNWIRTKHGYVLGTGAMFSELQRQAKGSFEVTVR